MATNDITIPSVEDMVSNYLKFIRNALLRRGVANPQTSEGSDYGIQAAAVCTQFSIIANNGQIISDKNMPDVAVETDLDRQLAIYGLSRRPASNAIGSVIASATSSSLVVTGTQLVNANGAKYQVNVGGIYGNGSSIPVISIDTGDIVNVAAGETLTWVSTPVFFSPTVTVSSINPISGGQDAEDDATARARLLAYFQNPPGAGNPAQLTAYAQAANAAVQTAFVYCAARGPGTLDMSVIGYQDTNNGNRQLDNTLLLNVIAPYVQGQLPQFCDGYITNVVNYPMDLSIALSLPASPNSIPAGPGGGWLDSAPLQTTTAKPAIRVIDGYALSGNDPTVPQNTSTSFWVDFPVDPASTITYSISYLSPITYILYSAVTSGTYVPSSTYASLSAYTDLFYVTINSPFYSSGNNPPLGGSYIFPTANNTAVYVQAVKDWFATLGPGERTNNSGLLPRALRQPIPQVAYPYKLNDSLLKAITSSGDEVDDSNWLFRGSSQDTSTSPTGLFVDYATKTVGSDPAYAKYSPPTTYSYFSTMQAPSFVFVINNLGLYYQQD